MTASKETLFPTVENTLPLAADDACTARIFVAKRAPFNNPYSLRLRDGNGSVFLAAVLFEETKHVVSSSPTPLERALLFSFESFSETDFCTKFEPPEISGVSLTMFSSK